MTEVYAVLLIFNDYDGESWDHYVQLREVFDSIEKARAYCEEPINYADMFSDWYWTKITPAWDETGFEYCLLDDDDSNACLSIQTRTLL